MELESCNEWIVDMDNRLSLHRGETEVMLCGTKRKIRNQDSFGEKCKEIPIDYVSDVKYLETKIDETQSG